MDRRSFLKSAALGGAMLATGEADAEYWDDPVSGRVTANGKPIGGVVVSDGRQCTETKADGTYRFPGRKGVRFITVTVPSGWRISRHYLPFASARLSYDFDLKPWAPSKPGPITFMHIGDSEIRLDLEVEKPWLRRAKAFADERDCAFFVHTGDIGTEFGDAHLRLMNEDTVGRPVFYVLGNHDVIHAERGERTFERVFGPCWYSFDAGNVHFVVTPMMWGDGTVSYSVDDVVDWLRNDLAIAARKKQPVVQLVHGPYDNKVFDACHLYDKSQLVTKDADPFDFARACDLRAVVHGHFHTNYFRRTDDGRITVVSVAPPRKDFATLQVIHVGADASLMAENRYGRGDWRETDEPPKGGWLAKVKGAVYYGAPCVANGRAVVGTIDFEGRMPSGAYAFDAKTGKPLWSFATRSEVLTHVVNFNGKMFVQDINWRVYALDEKTGRQVWMRDLQPEVGLAGVQLLGGATGDLKTTPTVDPKTQRLYCGTARTCLLALDTETGETVWRAQDSEEQRGQLFMTTPSRPVICGDTVVGGIFWEGLFGYDAKTGRFLWRNGRNRCTDTMTWYKSGVPWIERFGFPVYRDGKLYMATHSHFLEVEPRTGKILRQKQFEFSVNCYHEPLFLDDRVYFGSHDKGLVCFDMRKFDLAWTSSVEPSLVGTVHYVPEGSHLLSSSPVHWKGLIWATAQDGAVYAWDPVTGERKERIFTGAPYIASATVAEGRLYTADFTGRIRCFV